jgi:hypothetical protein
LVSIVNALKGLFVGNLLEKFMDAEGEVAVLLWLPSVSKGAMLLIKEGFIDVAKTGDVLRVVLGEVVKGLAVWISEEGDRKKEEDDAGFVIGSPLVLIKIVCYSNVLLFWVFN